MKKLSFFALAAAGLMLGACSSDKDDVVQQPTGTGTVWDGTGEGYMAIDIQLPTDNATSTRAANDDYDDGLADEYKVSDAALLLFAGSSEATATCISAQQLTLPFEKTDDDTKTTETPIDNLTSSYQVTAKVTGSMTSSDNLYALVCLNYKNVISITSGNATIGSQAVNGKKLSELMAAAYTVNGGADFYTKTGGTSKNYFFMTNAPLQYADGTAKAAAPTATQIQTLAALEKSKIKKTAAEAAADPAGNVYVERAVAKATLSWSSSAKLPGTVSGVSTPLDISKVEWVIDNKEPKSYVVRNMGDLAYIAYSSEAFSTAKYRMVGDTKMGKTATLHPDDADIYRTYWCVDPQYSAAATGMVRSEQVGTATNWGATGSANPQYCNENTFNVANQLYKNTTRAILKVTPTTTADFYTVNGTQERYSKANAESYLVQAIVDNSTVVAAFKAVTKTGKSFTIDESYFTIAYADEATTGKHSVSSISLNTTTLGAHVGTEEAKELSATPTIDFSDIITAVNNDVTVLKYTNGVVYYEARFQHFANTADESVAGGTSLAPWNTWEVTNKPSSTVAYPANTKTAEENYLGRYGMVRNNWYDVTVSAFNRIGSPVDPSGNVENPEYPDDNLTDYISVKIHVLSWAKRTQSWSF